MSPRPADTIEITPEIILRAYACGIFPMGERADVDTIHWIEPKRRGVLPLDAFHVPRRLARTVRSDRFEVVIDRDFEAVMDGCARQGPGREATWINARIRGFFRQLFDLGRCHTVEVYRDGRLAGGLYGLKLGAAFFGESMFHVERDASKVALVHLVALLRAGGFRLLDAQFLTAHLAGFGAVEIGRQAYRQLLSQAIGREAAFPAAGLPLPLAGEEAMRLATGDGGARAA
jgi:leucyl/phenylalanyl-tRNA--protein transferase